MKKIFTTLFVLIFSQLISQTTSWPWAKRAGGAQHDAGQSIVTDASGNSYVSGYFGSPAVSFGSYTLTNATATLTDIFLAKYDVSGNVVWAKSFGGSGSENAISIHLSVGGSVYMTGYFSSTLLTFGTYTLNGSGNKDFFIAKFDSNGNVLWAKSAGGSQDDFAYSVTTDPAGNVIAAGYFESGLITFGSTTLTNSGVADYFIVKHDPAGNVLWAKNGSHTRADIARSVAADASGNIYMTGYFYGSTMVFGTYTLTNTSVTTPPVSDPEGVDMFLVKYDASGNVLWAKSAGGREHEYGIAVSLVSGDVYLGGYFSSNSFAIGTSTLMNANTNTTNDIFIAKYDVNGNEIWANSAGGTNWDYLSAINTDASGNLYVSGQYQSISMSFGSNTLLNMGTYDGFLAKYDVLGNSLWAVNVGGDANDNVMGISFDAAGDGYITGYYLSTALTFSTTVLNNSGNFDVYVAKLSEVNVGIKELSPDQFMNLYPNPCNGQFFINIKDQAEKSNITLSNTLGEVLMSKEIPWGKSMVDLSTCRDGIYFVTITSGKTSVTRKILLQN